MKDKFHTANIPEAAEYLRIPVAAFEQILADGTGPEHIDFDDGPHFEWNVLEHFRRAKTICRDGQVIPKITAQVLDYKQDGGREYPVLACYCTGFSRDGSRILRLISPLGTRNTHGGDAVFGSGDGYRSEGYFIREVSDPKLAGFDDEMFLGFNALAPEYESVDYYY